MTGTLMTYTGHPVLLIV